LKKGKKKVANSRKDHRAGEKLKKGAAHRNSTLENMFSKMVRKTQKDPQKLKKCKTGYREKGVYEKRKKDLSGKKRTTENGERRDGNRSSAGIGSQVRIKEDQ